MHHPQAQAAEQFWNDPDIIRHFATKPFDPRIEELVNDYLTTASPGTGLDLGCGGGRHSELLARKGFRVLSVEPNPGMRDATRERLRDAGLSAQVLEGSILSIPVASAIADVVVTTGVLHQAECAEQYREAMAELARVVRPGGYVGLNVFVSGPGDGDCKPAGRGEGVVVTEEGLLMTLWSEERFVAEMRAAGFTMVGAGAVNIRQENTGERRVFRASFVRNSTGCD